MRHLAAIALLLTALAVGPAPAAAQDDTENPVTISEADQPVGGIIVKPNSGAPPQDAGDRGGALQVTLFALIVAFAGVAFFSIRRSSRRALATQGRT